MKMKMTPIEIINDRIKYAEEKLENINQESEEYLFNKRYYQGMLDMAKHIKFCIEEKC